MRSIWGRRFPSLRRNGYADTTDAPGVPGLGVAAWPLSSDERPFRRDLASEGTRGARPPQPTVPTGNRLLDSLAPTEREPQTFLRRSRRR
jgi:hypothetical protein